MTPPHLTCSPHPEQVKTSGEGDGKREQLRKRQKGKYKLIPPVQERNKERAREKGISVSKGQLQAMVADRFLDGRQRPFRKRWFVMKNKSGEEKCNEGVCI